MILTRAFGIGALCVSTNICLISTFSHSSNVNHSHHSQSIFWQIIEYKFRDQTGLGYGIYTLMLNADTRNGNNNIVLTKMSIVLPVCPSSVIVCWIVFILGFLFDSSSVPKPQLWNVEYGRNASSKLPFRLLLLTGSKADTNLLPWIINSTYIR